MQKKISEFERVIPAASAYDVLVFGGGPAGFFARAVRENIVPGKVSPVPSLDQEEK